MNFGEIDNFMEMGNGGAYLKMERNKTYVMKIESIVPKQGKFGKQLVYNVEYEGEKKQMASSSKRLWYLIKTNHVALGDTVELMKSGEGTATNWTLNVIERASKDETEKLEKNAPLPEASTKDMDKPPLPDKPDQQTNGEEISLDDIPF